MTGSQICKRAAELSTDKYWYGGKHQLATETLANRLRRENPSVWTDSYYAKALKDCDGHTMVCDCSGLVCYAYEIGEISSYGIEAKYPRWNDYPKDGMIVWRKGHVGIFDSGNVHELKGIDYDYQFKPYVASQWTKVLYDKNIDYDGLDIGWHKNMVTGQWWYQYGPGVDDYFANCVKEINGACYGFGSDGYMKEGTFSVWTDENGEIVGVY